MLLFLPSPTTATLLVQQFCITNNARKAQIFPFKNYFTLNDYVISEVYCNTKIACEKYHQNELLKHKNKIHKVINSLLSTHY